MGGGAIGNSSDVGNKKMKNKSNNEEEVNVGIRRLKCKSEHLADLVG